MTMREQEIANYQEILRLWHSMEAAADTGEKERLRSVISEKIDRWRELYKPKP